jgi:hypothetical protein
LVQRVLEDGWRPAAAAEAAGCSTRTAYKWVSRYRAEGEAGLVDRCSAPQRVPRRTFEMAVARRRPKPGLIHHSDQGSQYVSLIFGERCREADIDISTGGTSAYDNA